MRLVISVTAYNLKIISSKQLPLYIMCQDKLTSKLLLLLIPVKYSAVHTEKLDTSQLVSNDRACNNAYAISFESLEYKKSGKITSEANTPSSASSNEGTVPLSINR